MIEELEPREKDACHAFIIRKRTVQTGWLHKTCIPIRQRLSCQNSKANEMQNFYCLSLKLNIKNLESRTSTKRLQINQKLFSITINHSPQHYAFPNQYSNTSKSFFSHIDIHEITMRTPMSTYHTKAPPTSAAFQ
jgi:hypothetical protein